MSDLDSILSSPDSFAWSDWNTYAPTDTGMVITVTDSLDFGFYVLAVQARDPDGARRPRALLPEAFVPLLPGPAAQQNDGLQKDAGRH